MPDPIETVEGWYALHDFRQIDRTVWAKWSPEEQKESLAEFRQILTYWNQVEDTRQGSTGSYQIIGHKADLLFLNMRPSMDELAEIELAVDQSRLGQVLRKPYSYFSVVELSKYLVKSERDLTELPGTKERLYPILPKTHYVCFYPMNKRREGQDNWYSLTKEQRREIMKGHGIIGHKYADRVTQIITGSQGLDDWEWGVTLYADDTLDFKKLIYEMRFDEASARFAEFGPFLVGRRMTTADFLRCFA
ncbi:hydrogen peroxide-dependent heme synthase [Sulfobacillus sp. hq2]|uniref:hydrogen peroxide-dependent heme synthase n=1 Tax=Sulfobacillus TaxID=28033 RepID=UPI000CCFF02F|nr:hydrogen peroxide-dependent heme synthase [Sulfobacillus sp. hq2]POB09119.1 heme-dependent peroxidase [Sulfobacillus sp. hq2]